VLQQADTVAGPWQDLTVIGTNHAVAPDRSQQFFRLRER
jgi:hypothetical protein